MRGETWRRTMVSATAVAGGLFIAGCYRPHGPLLNYTGAPHTYVSTEFSPKTVVLIDTRTDEEIFAMDVPVGKQLVIQFVPNEGDDPVLRPDLMKYAVMPAGKLTGKLDSQMTVPNGVSRRVDWYLRPTPEYAEAPPELSLRSDQEANRPAWWTPEGGPIPHETRAAGRYDN